MSCKYLATLPAVLLLAACNQNQPTNTEVPTQAGATIPADPAAAATTNPTELTSDAGTPLEGGVAEPVPDEYSEEGDAAE